MRASASSSTTGAIVAAATKIQPITVTKPVPAARQASMMPQGPPPLSAAPPGSP